MKTRIATLFLLFGIFIASSVQANEPVPASKIAAQSVAQTVENEIDYPVLSHGERIECCVMVSIIIQEDGSFIVDGANSSNKEMKNHVVDKLGKLKSDELARYSGQRVLLKVNFNLLPV